MEATTKGPLEVANFSQISLVVFLIMVGRHLAAKSFLTSSNSRYPPPGTGAG